MPDSQQTVAIMYGWAEGPRHAARFARELEARGFTLISDPAAADIIFAHSSGCYRIPKDTKAKHIMLVGLPYGPVRRLAVGVMRKLIEEYTYHRRRKELGWWLGKLLYNGWYAITRPGATYSLLARHKAGNLPGSEERRVLLVQPTGDMLMYPATDRLLADKGYECLEVPGNHDSCWTEPRRYIDLLAAQESAG